MMILNVALLFYYFKVDLKLDIEIINIFLEKYLWIYIILTLLFILYIYKLILKIANPIQEISKITQKIYERTLSQNINLENKNKYETQLTGAVAQLAERIEMQLQLIEQNDARLRGVLENMSSGVLLIAKDRRIVLMNQAAEELIGYSRGDVIGKRHVEATRHSDMSETIEQCFTTRENIKKELTIYYPRELTLQTNFAPTKSENNEILGIVVILNDITDIRRLEKIRRDFVANVSHELKTPITSIGGFTETLLDDEAYKDNELTLHFLKIIKTESDRLLQIVNDLLDLSHIENGHMTLNREDFHLRKLVELLMHTLENKMIQNQLEFRIDIDENLIINADKGKISQILLNLLNNAVMYTNKGGKICIDAVANDNYINIIVVDSGIGIAKENLNRIFERFYRVDKSRTREKGGTGLGLAIVKHLVEAHKGKITVKSEVGKGTKFTIHIPQSNRGK